MKAVTDLNLECGEGEMLALLGPSGCGKSTTLRMAAGIETITSGEIWFGDRLVSHLPPGQRNIAMVFEDYGLYTRKSVRENIAFPLRVRGLYDSTGRARIDEVIALLGLGSMADQPVTGLSGGAMQRIAIGRALVRDPDLILFDEPLSHLDAYQKVGLRAEIRRLQQLRGITSILVTHDQTEAVTMADRIAVMNKGVLQQVAPPQELYERPRNLFVANFVGEPPMNLLPANVTSGGEALTGAGWQFTLPPAKRDRIRSSAQSLVMGLRPEHVSIERSAGEGVNEGEIIWREQQGSTDVLSVRLRGTSGARATLVAEVPGPSDWAIGDRVRVGAFPGRIMVFDTESELNLEAVP